MLIGCSPISSTLLQEHAKQYLDTVYVPKLEEKKVGTNATHRLSAWRPYGVKRCWEGRSLAPAGHELHV